MVTYTRAEIDWDTFLGSDGEPVAETVENAIQMVDLQFALRCLLETQGRVRVAVGGDQLMYDNQRNGRDHISPDVYVALDVAPGLRPTWKTWEEGKFPDIVFEITSPSTEDVDRGSKLELYTRLGAREYYIYDPQQVMVPPLRAYTRQGDTLAPLALLPTRAVVSPCWARSCGRWVSTCASSTRPRGCPSVRPTRSGATASPPRVARSWRSRRAWRPRNARRWGSRRAWRPTSVRCAPRPRYGMP